jgi:hypothetical protein
MKYLEALEDNYNFIKKEKKNDEKITNRYGN